MALYLGETVSIVFKTLPFLILRAAVYLLFGVLLVIYFGIIYLVGRAVSEISPNAEVIAWGLGLLVSFPLTRLAREYILYLVKAGHVAVISALATQGKLPEGMGQIAYGKKLVTENFKNSSVLFLVDRMVHGVIRVLTRLMMGLTDFLSGVPGIDGLRKIMHAILYFSFTYIDEAILARKFIHPEETAWKSAHQGLILYAQIWRSILLTALFTGLVALISLPIFLVLTIGPALGAAALEPQKKWLFITMGIIAGFVLKAVLVDPFTMTQMIVVYLKETAGLQPNPEWEQKIEAASSKFVQIKKNALTIPSA